MELLALDKPIKKPPRSDERDGDLFCGTAPSLSTYFKYNGANGNVTFSFNDFSIGSTYMAIGNASYFAGNQLVGFYYSDAEIISQTPSKANQSANPINTFAIIFKPLSTSGYIQFQNGWSDQICYASVFLLD